MEKASVDMIRFDFLNVTLCKLKLFQLENIAPVDDYMAEILHTKLNLCLWEKFFSTRRAQSFPVVFVHHSNIQRT